jgi:PAS domain S-box-containing protein
MTDPARTNEELVKENDALKQRVRELERSLHEHKLTGEELRLTSEIMTNMSEGVILTRVYDGTIVYANPKFESMFGYDREELKGKDISVINAPSGRSSEAGATEIEAILKENGAWTGEVHNKKKDGTAFWCLAKVSTFHHFIHGDVWVAVHTDITDRKRAEREMDILTKIGRLIGSTLDITEVYEHFAAEVRKLIPIDWLSVNLKNSDTKTLTIAYVDGMDIPERRPGDTFIIEGSITEAVMRKGAGLMIHPTTVKEMESQFLNHTASITYRAGLRSIMAVPLISHDDLIGTLHFRAKKPNAYTEQDLLLAERIGMQIAGAVANAQLYANIKITEMYLRESENKFRTLVDNAAVGITEVEAMTGRFVAVNPMFCEILGRTEEELLGTTFVEITHPDDLDQHPNLSKRMYGGELDHYTLEKRYIKKDGRVIWVNVTISRLWKAGEAPGRSITVVHDITERKKVEEALKETLDQLESRVRERTIELEEINIAMQVLLKKGDKEQKRVEDSLQSNINKLVMPFLSRLRKSRTNEERRTYLNILEANLNNITSPFINRLSATYQNLTPKEIQIAELVKQGVRSKEIAELFHVAVGTVVTHRNSIRRKLHLRSTSANLRSYLLSLV